MMPYSIETVSVSARETWILKPRKIKKGRGQEPGSKFSILSSKERNILRVSSFIKIIPFNIDSYFRIDRFFNVKLKNRIVIL